MITQSYPRFGRLSVRLSGVGLVWLLISCTDSAEPANRFVIRSPAETGVDFVNRIVEDDSVNLLVNEYTDRGVGVGDFNRDGLPDSFFTGNRVSSRLYLNRSDTGKTNQSQLMLRFEDVTRAAGVQTKYWCTGVSVIDINQDGWFDVYVCALANSPSQHNLLFINNGRPASGNVPTFTEASAAYGLADTGFSTQAAFLDYSVAEFAAPELCYARYAARAERAQKDDVPVHEFRALFVNQLH